jgi:hypothetical protein
MIDKYADMTVKSHLMFASREPANQVGSKKYKMLNGEEI